MIKKKAFLRYLFSYILVLIIPITIISYFMYAQFIDQFREEVIGSATRVLEQTQDSIDRNLQSFLSLSSNLSTNQNISYLLSHNNIESLNTYPYILDAVKELNKYKKANSIIENIFIIFLEDDVVLSDFSRYNFEIFTNYVFKLDKIKSQEFRDLLNNINDETILPLQGAIYNEKRMDVICYIQPLPMNDISPRALLMMTIDEYSLKRSISNSLSKYGGHAFIFDNEDHIILDAEFSQSKLSEDAKNVLLSESKKQDKDSYTITKNEYVISSVISPKNNWKYISVIPSANILMKVQVIQLRMVGIIVLTLIIGILVILYLSRSDYYKIRKIINSIEDYGKDLHLNTGQYKSEWELINETMLNYIKKSEALQEKIYQQIPIMKNSFFRRLINGKFSDEKSINDMLELLNINLNKQYYSVLIIEKDVSAFGIIKNDTLKGNIVKVNEPIREVVQAAIVDIVQNVVEKDRFIYAVEDKTYTINLIIGFDNKNEIVEDNLVGNTKYLQTIAKEVKESIKNDFGFTVTIGVGGLYNNLLQLSDSYKEASKALEYKILMGYDSVISYDDICYRGANRVCYSFKQEKELISFLKMGAYEEIQKVLDDIVHIIKSEPINIDAIKYIYFDIINTAMKAADEISIESANVEHFMEELTYMETLDEIYTQVSEFYKKLCNEIKEAKISKNTELRDNVIEYINKNYSDNGLSVDGISYKLSVSPSYLSRYMKDQLGYSLTDYIHEVRLQKAKILLDDTDKTIATIAEEVGYNSLHNFTRVFKRYERITPTEYRNYKSNM